MTGCRTNSGRGLPQSKTLARPRRCELVQPIPLELPRVEQHHVRNPMRKILQLRIGAIGEDDDGELLFRKPRDAAAEANRFAAVPDLLQPTVLADEPAVAVARARWGGGGC